MHGANGTGGVNGDGGIGALPGFLVSLNQTTSPNDVVRTLALGPLRPFNIASAFIATYDTLTLRVLGSFGYPPEFLQRYEVMAIEHDWPSNHAVTRNEIITVSFRDLFINFPGLEIDRELWEPYLNQFGHHGVLVSVPIQSQGLVRGVYGFAALDMESMTLMHSSLLTGISSALSLWLRGIEDIYVQVHTDPVTQEIPLMLTERQKQILLLVAEGKSNSSIASSLGYSVSTVKLDLNRAMRMLRTSERLEAVARARSLNLLPDVDMTPAAT